MKNLTQKQIKQLYREKGIITTEPSEVSSDDLLSCPFCGGGARYVEEEGRFSGDVAWSIGCENDECFGFVSMTTFARKTDARNAWNQRA